jgi:hypothetical protein
MNEGLGADVAACVVPGEEEAHGNGEGRGEWGQDTYVQGGSSFVSWLICGG